MFDLIFSRLQECDVMFPSYGERSAKDVELLAKIFAKKLAEWSEEDIDAAFDCALEGQKFPVLNDILAFKATQTAYQFDYGPLGFGALYSPDHPYVRQQMTLGQDISGHVVDVTEREFRGLHLEARNAGKIEYDNSEEPRPRVDRGGSGFKRLSFGIEENA